MSGFATRYRLLLGHYVENTGNTTLHFLEIFNSGMNTLRSAVRPEMSDEHDLPDRVQDISLSQVS